MKSPAATHLSRLLALTGLCVATTGFAAVDGPPQPSPQTAFRQDRQACLRGDTNEDLQTCLYEARSALRDKRNGELVSTDPRTLARNALRRCDAVPDAFREDCRRAVEGDGRVDGSLQQGVIVREVVSRVPSHQMSNSHRVDEPAPIDPDPVADPGR